MAKSKKEIKKSLREIRYDTYRKSLFRYGFLALCYLINHFQKTEDYEECSLIKSVIDDFNKEVGANCPTTWDEKAFKYFEDSRLTLNLSKPIEPIQKRVKEYAKEILDELKDLNYDY